MPSVTVAVSTGFENSIQIEVGVVTCVSCVGVVLTTWKAPATLGPGGAVVGAAVGGGVTPVMGAFGFVAPLAVANRVPAAEPVDVLPVEVVEVPVDVPVEVVLLPAPAPGNWTVVLPEPEVVLVLLELVVLVVDETVDPEEVWDDDPPPLAPQPNPRRAIAPRATSRSAIFLLTGCSFPDRRSPAIPSSLGRP
jgi:hypothetical protein